MQYIKVEFLTDPPLVAYQEVGEFGIVLRYLDEQGTFLFEVPPSGVLCVVTDPDPPRQPWMQ
jgi:hypothetical protein